MPDRYPDYFAHADYHPINWPFDIDSPDMLLKAIAECGVPQRHEAKAAPAAAIGSEVLSFGVRFPKNDRDSATLSHHELMRFAQGAIYARMATLPKDQIWVWRIMPEFEERETAKYRHEQFYARFWRSMIDV